MLPLVDNATNPYFPEGRNTDGPLPESSLLDSLSRTQLIDSLVRFSKLDSTRVAGMEGLVLEICLQYVGKRWREVEGEERVEEIAKELTEVEFEVSAVSYIPFCLAADIASILRSNSRAIPLSSAPVFFPLFRRSASTSV